MSASTNWFSSILCTKCFDPQQEARTEMMFENRSNASASGSNKKTIVYGVGNLKNKGLSDAIDLKTQASTKENAIDCSDIRLQHMDTALTTPRCEIELEVIESDFLQANEKFKINANGQINGKKAQNEKKILIGSDLPQGHNEQERNDIVCSKYNDKNIVQSAQLSINRGSFHLKDLGGGDGIYIKAEEKFALENHSIIHYGIGHLITEFVSDKEDNKKAPPSLKLKFMDGPNEGKERIIAPDQVCTFGRLPTCTVVFDEYGVSRIQCKFSYENDQWNVKDGDGYKRSTNGTWILLQDEKLVANKMVFKVCNTVFRANLPA